MVRSALLGIPLAIGLFLCGSIARLNGGQDWNPDPRTEADRCLKLLGDDNALVRKRALIVLERLGTVARPTAPILLNLLNSVDPAVRRWAARRLEEMGPAGRPALPDLLKLLHSAHPEARRWAALNVGLMGNEARAARDTLIASLNDADPAARAAKAEAIDRIDEQVQLASLVARMRDAKQGAAARGAACKDIASRFPHDAVARAALESALSDPTIKAASAEALEAADRYTPGAPRAILTLNGHKAYLKGLAFSPYGKRLASASDDGTVRLWDAGTGKHLHTMGKLVWDVNTPPNEVFGVAFSPDGRRLVSFARDRTVRVWDADTGKELLTIKGQFGFISSVAFSPDGKRLAVAGTPVVKLCDAVSGKVLLSCETVECALNKVTFSPDGTRVAGSMRLFTHERGPSIAVWDASSGKKVRVVDGEGKVGLAYSPDGTRLAACGYELKVYDAQLTREVVVPPRDRGFLNGVVFSPDGRLLAFAINNPEPGGRTGTFSIWIGEAATCKNLAVLKVSSSLNEQLAFSRDGTLLASSTGNDITIWDLAALKPRPTPGSAK